jgi:hypothetical protein
MAASHQSAWIVISSPHGTSTRWRRPALPMRTE